MITANTKVTALEVLNEVGINDAENVFGKMRVRIGGISGIVSPDHVINLPAEVKTVEVIVGNQVYDLELHKGNKEDNAEIATMTDGARQAKDAEGEEATRMAEHLTAVKELAARIRTAQDADEEYEATKAEKEILDEALERVEADREALAAVEAAKADREATKVKSK